MTASWREISKLCDKVQKLCKSLRPDDPASEAYFQWSVEKSMKGKKLPDKRECFMAGWASVAQENKLLSARVAELEETIEEME